MPEDARNANNNKLVAAPLTAESKMGVHDLLSHPQDIAHFAIEAMHAGRGVTLIFVTDTGGGGVRAPGLRMAVDALGNAIGYVSNGCVEADIIGQALEALAEGRPRALVYGAGSPNVDLRLPCGGRMDILAVPLANIMAMTALAHAMQERTATTLHLSTGGTIRIDAQAEQEAGAGWRFALFPKIRLIIMGSGQEAVLLARLADAADMQVHLYSPDAETTAAVSRLGLTATPLLGLGSSPQIACDPGTAVAVLFHDHEWELKILQQVLADPAFYVGALGSTRANERRRELLSGAGMPDELIGRLKAPIGLIPRLRDPNLLAISVLADITAEFQRRFGAF